MTSKQEIENWFDDGVKRQAVWMLVICDTFDHEDYPVYAMTDDECRQTFKAPGEMQRVMEVYDLSGDKREQMLAKRTMRTPDA